MSRERVSPSILCLKFYHTAIRVSAIAAESSYPEGHGNNNYCAALDLRMTHEVMKQTQGFMDTLYLRSKPD